MTTLESTTATVFGIVCLSLIALMVFKTTTIKEFFSLVVSIGVLLLVAIACEPQRDKYKVGQHIPLQTNGNVQTVVIDGCQYIYVPNHDASWGSHKGDCNNPIHYETIQYDTIVIPAKTDTVHMFHIITK